jgi:hypothetical protein
MLWEGCMSTQLFWEVRKRLHCTISFMQKANWCFPWMELGEVDYRRAWETLLGWPKCSLSSKAWLFLWLVYDRICVRQLSVTVTKNQRQSTSKEKRFILARRFKGFHDCLALLLWACDGTVHHGEQRRIHLMGVRKQRRIGKVRIPISSSPVHTQWSTSSH